MSSHNPSCCIQQPTTSWRGKLMACHDVPVVPSVGCGLLAHGSWSPQGCGGVSLCPVPCIWVSTQANLCSQTRINPDFKGTCSEGGIPPGDNQIFIYSWPSVGRGGPSTPVQQKPAASSRLPTGEVRGTAAWPWAGHSPSFILSWSTLEQGS